MKQLLILLLFPLALFSQTKTTLSALKAKTTFDTWTMYYTVQGKDTAYWLWKPGTFDPSENIILSKKKGGAFVRMLPAVQTYAVPQSATKTTFNISSRDGQFSFVNHGPNFKVTLRDNGVRSLYIMYANGNFQMGVSGAGLYLWNPPGLVFTGNDTFSVFYKGFDLILKENGREIYNHKHYDHVAKGVVSIGPADNEVYANVSNASLTTFAPEQLYSDIEHNKIDVRDYEPRTYCETVGDMDMTNPYLLTIAEQKYKVGDVVLVSPTTGLGTEGPGPPWPATVFDNQEAMQADHSYPKNRWARDRSTGINYVFDGSRWNDIPFWYYRYSRANLLRAKVLAVSGNRLILDQPCQTAVKGAHVELDYFFIAAEFMRLRLGIQDNSLPAKEVFFPPGRYAFSEDIQIGRKTGWTFRGVPDSTIFYSPKGARIFYASLYQSPKCTVRDITIEGNGLDDDWGVKVYATSFEGQANAPIDDSLPNLLTQMIWSGFRIGTGSDSCKIINVKFIHPLAGSVAMEQASYNLVDSCKTNAVPMHEYAVWHYVAASGSRMNVFSNIDFDGPMRVGAGEAFNADSTLFINWTVNNGMFSSNSSTRTWFKNFTHTNTANNRSPWDKSTSNPYYNANDNAYKGTTYDGGGMDNVHIYSKGFVDTDGNGFAAVNVQDDCTGFSILNSSYEAPENIAGTPAPFIISTGVNTLVYNCESYNGIAGNFHGLYQSNIGIKSGTIINSRVKYLYAPVSVIMKEQYLSGIKNGVRNNKATTPVENLAKSLTIAEIMAALGWAFGIVVLMSKHFKTLIDAWPSVVKSWKYIQKKMFHRAIFEKDVMEKLEGIEKEVKINGGKVFLADVVKEIRADLKLLSMRQDATETRLEAGFQLAGRMYGVFNRNSECIDINPVFLKRFGWAQDDILQAGYENIIHEDDRREMQNKFARAITTGSKFSEPEVRMFDSNQTQHRVCMTGYPNFNRLTEQVENYFVTFEILKP